MKTSIKLLLGLALALVIAMFGAAISIRKQFDSIDKTDPYSRWQKHVLPAFKAIKITGPSAAQLQIERGDTPRLLADTLNEWRKVTYTYRVDNDTLFLAIKPDEGWVLNPDATDDEWLNPQLIVQIPSINYVSTTNVVCQIRNFKGNTLTLAQGGKAGRLTLVHLTYKQLTANLAGRNQLILKDSTNKITRGAITVRDSARLIQDNDFTQGLTLVTDPGTTLKLTGKALLQAQQ